MMIIIITLSINKFKSFKDFIFIILIKKGDKWFFYFKEGVFFFLSLLQHDDDICDINSQDCILQ